MQLHSTQAVIEGTPGVISLVGDTPEIRLEHLEVLEKEHWKGWSPETKTAYREAWEQTQSQCHNADFDGAPFSSSSPEYCELLTLPEYVHHWLGGYIRVGKGFLLPNQRDGIDYLDVRELQKLTLIHSVLEEESAKLVADDDD